MATLQDALAAVLAAPAGSLKLSRMVAYALGNGDPISRQNYERYGADMHPPGQPKKGSGWFPTAYTETLDAAGKPLPAGWYLQSGVGRTGAFAEAQHEEHDVLRETAATEPLARLAVTLRARITERAEVEPSLEDLLS